jgi:O6-methylguanine-DNA--protein-cysteine methyltransferase
LQQLWDEQWRFIHSVSDDGIKSMSSIENLQEVVSQLNYFIINEPVSISNSILKAPTFQKKVWAALQDIPLEKQELISKAKVF